MAQPSRKYREASLSAAEETTGDTLPVTIAGPDTVPFRALPDEPEATVSLPMTPAAEPRLAEIHRLTAEARRIEGECRENRQKIDTLNRRNAAIVERLREIHGQVESLVWNGRKPILPE